MHPYRKPFIPTAFYLVPALWLEDICQPRELDARELLLFHHDPHDNVIVFPEDCPSAYWVRENDAGLPSLMSHPTYRAYRDALLKPDRQNGPLLKAYEEHRECYYLVHWPRFQDRPIYFRPKAYLENRWPVWLGSQWPARAALVGLMVLAAVKTAADAHRTDIHATVGEIRTAATAALPGVDISRHVRGGLRDLQRLGLVTEAGVERRGATYRYSAEAFERSPEVSSRSIAEICALDPIGDEPWIELIAAFLRRNGLLLDDAPRIWRQILAYERHVCTEDDARALLAEVEQRAGHTSTAVKVVLNEYARRAVAKQSRWLRGNEVEIRLGAKTQLSPEMTMPELYGENHHLRATQLLIHYERRSRLSANDAATAVDGLVIDIHQPPSTVSVIDVLRANNTSINRGTRLNCNHLHRALIDYAQPFQLLVQARQPEPRLTLRCQFRVLTT